MEAYERGSARNRIAQPYKSRKVSACPDHVIHPSTRLEARLFIGVVPLRVKKNQTARPRPDPSLTTKTIHSIQFIPIK